MKHFRIALLSALLLNIFTTACKTTVVAQPLQTSAVIAGAERMDEYLPMLQGKKAGLVINQTSRVMNALLADTLLARGVAVKKIMVPEHGFRGTADAGAHVDNGKDKQTGLPIISLYGKNKKPTAEQLKDIDVVVYDLQDVGARFYTYISTLEYVMQACAENGKEIIVLDRPNPNGYYVDGPVLEEKYKSFVGMQKIPAVYGMTVGEYAKMLVGEKLFAGADKVKLTVITCRGYDHNTTYSLPVSPSPNLKTDNAVQLYPSMCFFEGTNVSLGRGTDHPFEQWGSPDYAGKLDYVFTPQKNIGSSSPQYEGQKCYGDTHYQGAKQSFTPIPVGRVHLASLIQAYRLSKNKDKFFIPYFETLAGTAQLRKDIIAGKSAEDIRKSWRPEIEAFKKVRKKYLLYKDFE